MRFSAKRYALAALSAYYSHTEIVKNFVIWSLTKIMSLT